MCRHHGNEHYEGIATQYAEVSSNYMSSRGNYEVLEHVGGAHSHLETMAYEA